jgi:hypothetical protein
MPTYSLSQSAKIHARRQVLRLVPLLFLAYLPIFVFFYAFAEGNLMVLALATLPLFVVCAVGLALAARQSSSQQVTITNDTISFDRGTFPLRVVKRSDITTISENPLTGLTIRTDDPALKLFISNRFDKYQQLRSALDLWSPIEVIERPQFSWLPIYIALLYLDITAAGAFLFGIRLSLYAFGVSFLLFSLYPIASGIKIQLTTKNRFQRYYRIIVLLILTYFLIRIILLYI